jgi:polysaccharide export outer membrane protein
MLKRVIVLVVLLLSLSTVSARGQQGPPEASTPSAPLQVPAANDPAAATATPAPAGGGPLVVDERERYVIQVSDEVELTYRYTPEFNFTGRIQPDGFISAPVIGDVHIAGYTISQARDVLLKVARQRLRDPEMSFVLKDFVKPLFTVGGEVEKPGQFELRGRVGVLEAVAIAGGFKRSAKGSQVVLLRRFDNDRATARLIDAKALQKMPDPEHDIKLQPGDLIMVPRNKLSYVEPYVPIASLILLSPFAWAWAH